MCMWAICNTSTKWSPYNPSDGFHPIFHFILGISHEQKSLMIDRHLFPVPCTTWKMENKSLLASSSEKSSQCFKPPKIWVKMHNDYFNWAVSHTIPSCAAAPRKHRLVEDKSRTVKCGFLAWGPGDDVPAVPATSESTGCKTLQKNTKWIPCTCAEVLKRLLPIRGTKWIVRYFSAWEAVVARSAAFPKSLGISSSSIFNFSV